MPVLHGMMECLWNDHFEDVAGPAVRLLLGGDVLDVSGNHTVQ